MEEVISALAVIVIFTLIIVWVIGIALALSRWRRHPRVSLFALLAFGLMLVSRFVGLLAPPIMSNYELTSDQRSSFFTAIGIFTALAAAIAWALVICAIFGWRDGPQKQNFPPPASPAFDNAPREQNATP